MPGVALQQRQAGARGEVGGGECGAVSLVLGRCLGWNRIIVGGESAPGGGIYASLFRSENPSMLVYQYYQASHTIPVFNKHERQSSFINFISFHQVSIKLLTTNQSRLAFLNYT